MKIGIGYVAGLVAVTALATWGITRSPSRAMQEGAPGEVLAKVGDYEITRQEVEEVAPDRFIRANQQLHELTENALAQAIDNRLLETEAENRGMSVDSLVQTEITAKLSEPTDAQVDSIYQAYRSQINAPRDSVAPQIRVFLARQQGAAAMQAFLAVLRAKYEVRNLLEPERVEVAATGPSQGPADAPITLIEFSDFECPFCYRVLPTIKQVRDKYGDQVRFVYRQFPLTAIHPHAQLAAEASVCADAQGKFWPMHDSLFVARGKVDEPAVMTMAAKVGLDSATFAKCLDSGESKSRVTADLEAGRKAGVTGTPALFINGRFLSGAQPFSVVERVIDDELARQGK